MLLFTATRPRRGVRRPQARRTQPPPRRNWRLVLRLTGIVLVLGGLIWGLHSANQRLLDSERFPLRHVRLQGELRNLDEADLRAMVADSLGQNFFSLNIEAIHAVFAANPWVAEVSVRRSWPDTLEIRFRERVAFAYWNEDEMVDTEGRRFRPTTIRQTEQWPYLGGPDGNELRVIRAYQEASALLNTIELPLIRMVQDERRAWLLETANGIRLTLGRARAQARLQRFIEIYPRVLADQAERIVRVDLRYDNGFAIQWADTRPGAKVPAKSGGIAATAWHSPTITPGVEAPILSRNDANRLRASAFPIP